MEIAQRGGAPELPLTAFEIGKLKIAAHVREELDRAGITAESIQCKSGGTHTNRNTARVIVTVDGTASHLDLTVDEVEDCESIVAGETWHKIAVLINRLR
jgi:galactitol-specific phosphotransferase system IIB component